MLAVSDEAVRSEGNDESGRRALGAVSILLCAAELRNFSLLAEGRYNVPTGYSKKKN